MKKRGRTMLTLQFVTYSSIASLSSQDRIRKILQLVKDEKIVLLEGRLKEEEEAELIKATMESITDRFSGIELGVIPPEKRDSGLYKKLQQLLVRLLLGTRDGFTIVGPANIIKEIKKDPDKIQLFTKEAVVRKKKRR